MAKFDDMGDSEQVFFIIRRVAIFSSLALCLGLWGCPQYNVWQQSLSGKAELSRAEYNRQITIQEANAKKEAAKSLADAEIERARGVAEANHIIANSLKDNEAYLRYLWIDKVADVPHQVIYVPTEAGLPILEAGRGIAKQ